jgi:sporulation integral membrane protein YtvI
LAAAAVWGFGHAWPLVWAVLWPFLGGAAWALLVERPVQWLVGRGVDRGWAALVCVAGVLAVTVALGGWALAAAWSELRGLSARLPGWYAAWTQVLHEQGGAGEGGPGAGLRAALARELVRAFAATGPVVQQLLGRLQHLAAGLPDLMFALFVAVATAYFLSRDRPQLGAWLQGQLGQRRARWLRVLDRALRESVWGLLRAQLLLAGATFAVSLLGLWLIGAPYAFLASLAAAVFDLLPVLGPAMVFVPWIVAVWLQHLTGAALGLAAVLLAVAAVRWLLTPHLLGAQVGLHPFVALAAMYVGVKLAGVAGLLLGPLGAVLLQALWEAEAAPLKPPRGPAP